MIESRRYQDAAREQFMQDDMPSISARVSRISELLETSDLARGPRLSFRPLTHDDIDDRYLGWFADAAVTEYLDAKNITRDDAIEHMDRGIASGGYWVCAVCDRTTGLHIGNAKLGPIAWSHGVSDLVTVIGDRTYWGRGIGTETVAIASRLLLQGLGLRKLHAAMYAGNVGSTKAYTRAGWFVESRLKDHLLHNGVPMDLILVSCFPGSLRA